MSIHFAAARSTAHSPVARALAKKALRRAANDNPGGTCDGERRVLHAALRHFAEHGLRAAEEAAEMAERAWRSGEPEASAWWTEICHKLDRNLALDVRRRMEWQDVG